MVAEVAANAASNASTICTPTPTEKRQAPELRAERLMAIVRQSADEKAQINAAVTPGRQALRSSIQGVNS
jgi:hypothetical protein